MERTRVNRKTNPHEPGFDFLAIAGRVINAETSADVDGQPSWMPLPAVMKMRMSTPHYLKQMKGKASPFGFVMHPRTREKVKLTLLTPFCKNRAKWPHSICINTHDGKRYNLNELKREDIVTLGGVLCGYIQHPEIKSLGPDGQKCKAHTRGLLRRMTVNGGLQHCIGKEVSRFEQGKDDFIENIDDVCIQYDGGRVAANESLVAEISKRGLRKTTKETGLDRKTIRAILNGKKVKASTLVKVAMGLRAVLGLERFPLGLQPLHERDETRILADGVESAVVFEERVARKARVSSLLKPRNG